MRFSTKRERLLHPQGKIIPDSLWTYADFFNYELSIQTMDLMQLSSEEEIFYYLKNQSLGDTPIPSSILRSHWLAIALTHPNISDRSLLTYANQLHLSDLDLLKTAAATGRTGVIKLLLNPYDAESIQNKIPVLKWPGLQWINHALGSITQRMAYSLGFVHAKIAVNDYVIFRLAAKNGHLGTLNYLASLLPNYVQGMLSTHQYEAFQSAIAYGHINVINFFATEAAENIEEIISAKQYLAFRTAANWGKLEAMNRLIELAPNHVGQMISANNYAAFRGAAEFGQLNILNRLIELAPDETQAMVKSYEFEAFRKAVRGNHSPVLNRLLSFSSVLGFAEQNRQAYDHIVQPFIHQQLSFLHHQHHESIIAKPNVVFDIENDEEHTKRGFYIVRNLIRQNTTHTLDDIRFLINIPSIGALLHTSVNNGQTNELLRLAIQLNNQEAASVLLTIPAVHELAVQNNFYREEANGRFDLEAIALDPESSMRALTSGERIRLDATLNCYEPIVKTKGVSQVMTELRECLEQRYLTNPATFQRDDTTSLILPLNWDAFQALELSPSEKQRALTAYYQQKAHTAWRYLSKPNPWIAENASYVNTNSEHTERWSSFVPYQFLIAILYTAAIDKTIPPIDGYSFDTRRDHFIDELAHIGRAHNWDGTRERQDSNGKSLTEEYDDLEGDKPSCYSGANRRLFQSVQGHPLLKMLTRDGVEDEIRDFVRTQFMGMITFENRHKLTIAWQEVLERGNLTPENMSYLNLLTINDEQQHNFINQINIKYPGQLSGDFELLNYVKEMFQLTDTHPNHAVKFGGMIDLSALLEVKASVSESGLFSNPPINPTDAKLLIDDSPPKTTCPRQFC